MAKKTKRMKHPPLPEREQSLIYHFLKSLESKATNAVEVADASLQIEPGNAWGVSSKRYWSTVVSGIRWGLSHVASGQDWLIEWSDANPEPESEPCQQRI